MLFLAPYRMPLNENGRVQPGVQIWFTQTGTDVEVDTYSDGDLTTVNANPYVASGTGRVDPIYLDPDVTYRIRLYSPWATPGVDTPLEEYDPYTPLLDASALAVLAADTGADDTGADRVGWRQSGTDAVGRSVRDKLRESVSVVDFGAVGDAVTDDTAAIQAAIDSLGAAGGTVLVTRGMRCVVNSSLTVKPNVTLKGAYSKVGSPQDNTAYPYDQLSGILLDAGATITLKGGAGLDGMLIQRKGITYPANLASFAGTAVTGGGDDNFIVNSMILGFAQAFTTTYQRPRLADVNIDCTAGVSMTGVLDIPYLFRVHCWPFTNVGSGGLSLAHRSGTAFLFTDCDWPKLTDCFSYGYFRGLSSNGTDDLTTVNCSFDGTKLYAGSMGVAITGDALRNRHIGLHVSSQDIGIYVNATASAISRAELVCASVVSSTTHNILVDSGDLAATACSMMDAPTGIAVANASSKVEAVGCKFATITASPINCVPANTNVVVFGNDYGSFAGNPVGGVTPPSVASAATLTLPHIGETFTVTGTTGITAIQYPWAGRTVRLIFSAALTVTNGASLKLAGAVNFSATADDTLTLVGDGTVWREVARSVN